MKMTAKALLTAAMVLTAGSFCFAAEQVDNPSYKSWAKFKAGTTVTLKTESDMAGQKSDMETTTTLVEINPDKAVIETKMSMNAGGQQMDMPAQKTDVPAKLDKTPEVKPEDPKDKPEVKESSEEVSIPGGKKVKAKVTETKMTANGMNTVSKVWTSEEVPGGVIKMETTMDGAMKGTTKMELTACEIK
jgi:hypothetical protein